MKQANPTEHPETAGDFMSQTHIHVKGAREHNLKNLEVWIPRDKLVVITGLSGSGKSTLAFDTIYAEGQRRYVESLSSYARQFLDQMEKPEVEFIEGLSPAISIEQKTTSRNPRSTVATVTEIYDYLRLLFCRIGVPHCPDCGRLIEKQSASQIIAGILALPEGTAITVLAPVVRDRKGEYRKLFKELHGRGYSRALVDGVQIRLEDPPDLDKQIKHTIEVVIDRIKVAPERRERVADACENALKLAEGMLKLAFSDGREPKLMSENLVCLHCERSFPELAPRNFSFNSPHGACPTCDGLGETREFDENLVVPDARRELEVAIAPFEDKDGHWYKAQLTQLAANYGFSLRTPFNRLNEAQRQMILHGSDDELLFDYNMQNSRYQFKARFEGVMPLLKRRFRETSSQTVREQLEAYMSLSLCQSCQGLRLQKQPMSVTIEGMNIAQFTTLSVAKALAWISAIDLKGNAAIIAEKVLAEVTERLRFLNDVGLSYLNLNRNAGTLSGGESQRIRLATQLGSKLMGVLYVLDEPSIGLHQKDNRRLLETLRNMRDLGNTVLVVEHDEETIREADYVLDMGPGAGEHGGELVFAGTPAELERCPQSITGQFLAGVQSIPTPNSRRKAKKTAGITIIGAQEHNLKEVDVTFPIGVLTCVTGVSGSGKSTLVHEILYKAAHNQVYGTRHKVGRHQSIKGLQAFDKIIEIDQSPIGRTPRSNPATYVGLFAPLRDLFASTQESKARGYSPGRFSFNVKGGRCEVCQGDGLLCIEMHFLPDVYVTCEECKGKRYNRETLEIRYRGHNIHEVLEMTVEEALQVFANIPKVKSKLSTLMEVGLGYIRLGQSATTLSGGEAQRVKLSKELSKRSTGQTLYLLDEPTTGLHFADVRKLLEVLHRLVAQNNTMVVIEHNLDVIRCADHVIDMGPEGGDLGGEVIAMGTPEEVAANERSWTGRYLAQLLGQNALTR